MKTILSVIIYVIQVAALVPLCAYAAEGQLDKGKYEITCEGAKVTVRANDADVAQLLKDFSKKSGVTFNKYVGKRKTATLDLNSVTTEEFLNRVLGSYVATSKKKNGATQISKVTIMDEGEDTSSPPSVKEKSKERPRRPSRRERSASRRKRRSMRPPRSRKSDEPQPPKPPDQSSEEPTDESQPPESPDQPPEDPQQNPQSQESEEQPEEQPEL